jgi:membrane associated rhomboid family serine protease
MHSAAVGFQCPDCVREGAKQTRQGHAMYGGQRSADPSLTSKVLIGLNLLVWGAIMATGGATSRLVGILALTPNGQCSPSDQPGSYYPQILDAALCRQVGGAEWTMGVADGAVWQVLTSAFTHIQIFHILMNMLALWFLGPQIEAVLGRARFLGLYFGSALAASALVVWLAPENSNTLGASGAVFGMLGALLVLVFKVRANPQQLLFWIGLNFVITFMWSDYISWQGHLGGFLGGLAIAGVIAYAPRHNRAVVQWTGVAAVTILSIVAIGVRALML